MSGSADDLHTLRSPGRWLPEIPEVPLGQRYEVAGEPIGKGGFGVVYRAKKRLLPQWVAVKRLRSDNGEHPSLEEQRRFVREVKLAASLDHPNILRIEDWGRDVHGLYVVMALIEGGSLLQQVEQHGAVPLGKLLQYGRQICLGLQAAHRKGIIHRDLKPANVLLANTGRVLLADFGLARDSSGSRGVLIHSSGQPRYTYAYASPEQMAGESVDVRTDLFSLGATLYHLTIGKPPFDRDFDLDAIPTELRALLGGLLKKKRDQRPATVDVVLEHFTELLKLRMAAMKEIQEQRRQVPDARLGPKGSQLSDQNPAQLWTTPRAVVRTKSLATRATSIENRRANVATQTSRHSTAWRRIVALTLVPAIVCGIAAMLLNGSSNTHRVKQSVPPGTATEQPVLPPSTPSASLPDAEMGSGDVASKSRPDVSSSFAAKEEAVVEPAEQTAFALQAPFDEATAKAAQAAVALALRQPEEWTNSVGMKFRAIPAGTFVMGSPEAEGGDNERPQHSVNITKPFWLGIEEVTQTQWRQVMATTPWEGEDYSIEGSDVAASWVSWHDAVEFCQKLSRQDGKRYRLPTEAEWEWACRAGKTTSFSFGDDDKQLQEYAWFKGNAWGKNEMHPHRVGQKLPNAFGLYDVHGNVWEWCADWHDDGFYANAGLSDPQGPHSGSFRVLRGGSWVSGPMNLRSSYRFHEGLLPVPVKDGSIMPVSLRTSHRDGGHNGYLYYSVGCRVVLEGG
jgi:formylglycine-generating enzyme required for sulfatase activity/serine/threonine protein kinase